MRSFREEQRDRKREEEQPGSTIKGKTVEVSSLPLSPIILKNESQNESGGQQKLKASMESLCNSFLQNVVASLKPTFEIKELTTSTNLPPRRGYDLMNILEGCGFVSHVSKGTYRWNGFQPIEDVAPWKDNKKQSTLRNLARKVKLSLMDHSHPLDFKDLCARLVEQNRSHGLNPKSIKRRVYECCKVLKVLGLVEKQGQKYRWVLSYRQKLQQLEEEKKALTTKTKAKQNARSFLPVSPSSVMVSRLIETISTEEQLNSAIRELRQEFMKKMEYGAVNRQLKFQ